MKTRLPSVLCFCVLFATAPPAGSGENLVLRADRLLDVRAGVVIQDAFVEIEGDRILRVGTSEGNVRANAVDLGDKTLLPGLVDTHTHLTFDMEGDWVNQPVKDGPADLALRGARNARRTLYAGFTTVRDLGAWGFSDVALMRAIDKGWIEGPRIFPSAYMIGITGGHCDVTGFAPGVSEFGPQQGIADGVDEVLKAVRYQIKHGAKWIKACATAGVSSFEGSAETRQLSDEELQAVVEEASRHGVKVAAHAHGTEGIMAAARAGVTSIEHGSMLNDEAIRLLIASGTYLVPTVYTWQVPMELPAPIAAKNERLKSHIDGSVRAAIRAGVKIAFGTDSGTYRHGDNAREFAALVERGMAPIDAIRSATVVAAELLGVSDRGAIEPGLLADLIAVPGNPLQDIRVLEDVRFVMIGGRVLQRIDLEDGEVQEPDVIAGH